MDGMSPAVPSRDFGIYGTAKLELLDDLKAVAGKRGLRYTPDPKPEAGYFFRSDHFSFAKRGVPALSYSAGQDWEVGGVAAGKAASDDYTAKRYHQQGDQWQPDWTFAGASRDLLDPLHPGHAAGRFAAMAKLEHGFRIPRDPRYQCSATEISRQDAGPLARRPCLFPHRRLFIRWPVPRISRT